MSENDGSWFRFPRLIYSGTWVQIAAMSTLYNLNFRMWFRVGIFRDFLRLPFRVRIFLLHARLFKMSFPSSDFKEKKTYIFFEPQNHSEARTRGSPPFFLKGPPQHKRMEEIIGALSTVTIYYFYGWHRTENGKKEEKWGIMRGEITSSLE